MITPCIKKARNILSKIKPSIENFVSFISDLLDIGLQCDIKSLEIFNAEIKVPVSSVDIIEANNSTKANP